MPPGLASALAAEPAADAAFRPFGAATKKQLPWWIAGAKRDETRARRVAQVVAAAAGRNPLAYTPQAKG